jgi:hypothetical protein
MWKNLSRYLRFSTASVEKKIREASVEIHNSETQEIYKAQYYQDHP